MPQDKVKDLYDMVSETGAFSSEDEFRGFLKDEKALTDVFDMVKETGAFTDINEYKAFTSDILKKKVGGEELSSQYKQLFPQATKPIESTDPYAQFAPKPPTPEQVEKQQKADAIKSLTGLSKDPEYLRKQNKVYLPLKNKVDRDVDEIKTAYTNKKAQDLGITPEAAQQVVEQEITDTKAKIAPLAKAQNLTPEQYVQNRDFNATIENYKAKKDIPYALNDFEKQQGEEAMWVKEHFNPNAIKGIEQDVLFYLRQNADVADRNMLSQNFDKWMAKPAMIYDTPEERGRKIAEEVEGINVLTDDRQAKIIRKVIEAKAAPLEQKLTAIKDAGGEEVFNTVKALSDQIDNSDKKLVETQKYIEKTETDLFKRNGLTDMVDRYKALSKEAAKNKDSAEDKMREATKLNEQLRQLNLQMEQLNQVQPKTQEELTELQQQALLIEQQGAQIEAALKTISEAPDVVAYNKAVKGINEIVSANQAYLKELEGNKDYIKAKEDFTALLQQRDTAYTEYENTRNENMQLLTDYVGVSSELQDLQQTRQRAISYLPDQVAYEAKVEELKNAPGDFNTFFRPFSNGLIKFGKDVLSGLPQMAGDIVETATGNKNDLQDIAGLIQDIGGVNKPFAEDPSSLINDKGQFELTGKGLVSDLGRVTGFMTGLALTGGAVYGKTLNVGKGNLLKEATIAPKTAEALAIMPAYISSYNEYADLADEKGYTGLQKISFANSGALFEGLSEMIFPEWKLFSKSAKQSVVKSLKPNATFQDYVLGMGKAMGLESAEEISVELFAPINTWLTNMAGDKQAQIDAIKMANIQQAVLLSVISAGTMKGVAMGKSDISNRIANYTMATNQEDASKMIQGMVDEELITPEEGEARIEQIQLDAETLSTMPTDLTDAKKAAILPLQKQFGELTEKANDETIAENFRDTYKQQAKIVGEEISTIVQDPAFDNTFNKEFEEEQKTIKPVNAETTETAVTKTETIQDNTPFSAEKEEDVWDFEARVQETQGFSSNQKASGYSVQEDDAGNRILLRIKDHNANADYMEDELENDEGDGYINVVIANPNADNRRGALSDKESDEKAEKVSKKTGKPIITIRVKEGETVSGIQKKIEKAKQTIISNKSQPPVKENLTTEPVETAQVERKPISKKETATLDKEAQALGFDNIFQATSSVNKRLKKDYKDYRDIPKEELKQVSEERKPVTETKKRKTPKAPQYVEDFMKDAEKVSLTDKLAEMFFKGQRVTPESFYQFGDRNKASSSIKLKYFAGKPKGGQAIDQLAADLMLDPQFEGMNEKEIIETIVEFITNQPSPEGYMKAAMEEKSNAKEMEAAFYEGRITEAEIEDINAKEEIDKGNEDVIQKFLEDGGYLTELGEIDFEKLNPILENSEAEKYFGELMDLSDAEIQYLKDISNENTTEQAKEPRSETPNTVSEESADKGSDKQAERPKISDKAKAIADEIRKGKIGKPDIFSVSAGSVVWDTALEIVATTIEKGGTLAQAVSDAITHIKSSDWYKGLSDVKKRNAEIAFKNTFQEFQEEMEEEPIAEPVEEPQPVEEPTLSGIKKKLVPEAKIESFDIERRTSQQMLDYGRGLVETGEINPVSLVIEIKDSPRALQPEEVAALVYYKAQLDNKIERSFNDIEKYKKEGNLNKEAQARTEYAAYTIQLNDYHEMSLITAYEQSLAFRLRKMLLDSEYNLQSQIRQYKAVNNGVIPPDILQKFQDYDSQIKELNAKIEELQKQQEEEEGEDAVINIVESVEREYKGKKPSLSEAKKAKKKSLGEALRKEYFGRFNDVTGAAQILADKRLYEYAALVIEETAGDFNNFAKEMIKTLGKGARKYLPEIYKKAGGKQETIFEDNKPTIRDNKLIIPNSLIRDLVAAGFDNINTLTDEIYDRIKEKLPNVTKRNVRDAITQYGKTVNLSKEELDVKIRELKRLGRLISQLEDVQAKKRPLRSGLQRDKITAEERRLLKAVKEGLKDIPMNEGDVKKAWATALEGVKTRLRNQIEDLQKQIDTGEKTPPRAGITYDQEAQDLVDQRDALKAIIEKIEGKRKLSDEQRLRMAEKAVERGIAELEQRIKDKDYSTPEKLHPISSDNLEDLKKKRDFLKKQLAEMAEEAGVAEQKRVETYKKNLKSRVQKYEERIKNKDYGRRPKKVKPTDAEIKKLEVEMLLIKDKFDLENEKAIRKNRPLEEKAAEAVTSVLTIGKALSTAVDISAVGLQGLYIASRNPRSAIKAMGEMFKQAGSISAFKKELKGKPITRETFAKAYTQFFEDKGNKWMAELKSSENYLLMRQSKLYLGEATAKLSAMEEAFMSKFVKYIPYIALSQNMYNAYLNKLRVDVFNRGADYLIKNGYTFEKNEKDFKDLATFINVATGRGSLGKLGDAATPLLNIAIFSPRYLASRVSLLNPVWYYKKNGYVRAEALKNTAAYITLVGALMGLAVLGGADLEEDPRSGDFGKIKFGKFRFNLLGGFQTLIVLFTRTAAWMLRGVTGDRVLKGEYKDDKGKLIKLGDEKGGIFTPTMGDVYGRFLRGKLSPLGQMAVNMSTGKDFLGEPTTLEKELLKQITPLSTKDLIDIYEKEGIDTTAVILLPALLGWLQYYEEKKKEKKKKKPAEDKQSKSGFR